MRRAAHVRRGPGGKLVRVREHNVKGSSAPAQALADVAVGHGGEQVEGSPISEPNGVALEMVDDSLGVVRGGSYAHQDLRRLNTMGNAARFVEVDFNEAHGMGTRFHGVYADCSMKDLKGYLSDHAGSTHLGTSFERADLGCARLPEVADRCDFASANLRVATSQYAVFNQCEFSGAEFSGSNHHRAEFRGCDLSAARGLEDAVFVDCGYDDATSFPDGYAPEEHGWVRLRPLTEAESAQVRTVREDALV